MKIYRLFIALFGAVLLSGCAHKYAEPTTGPIAKVTFINKDSSGVLLRVLDNENCERKEISASLGLITGDKGLFDLPSSKTVLIRADRLFVLNVQGFDAVFSSSCNMTIQADLEANGEYELEFKEERAGCRVGMTKIARDGGEMHRTAVPIRRNPQSCVRAYD